MTIAVVLTFAISRGGRIYRRALTSQIVELDTRLIGRALSETSALRRCTIRNNASYLKDENGMEISRTEPRCFLYFILLVDGLNCGGWFSVQKS
jgi:hypothetical protein